MHLLYDETTGSFDVAIQAAGEWVVCECRPHDLAETFPMLPIELVERATAKPGRFHASEPSIR